MTHEPPTIVISGVTVTGNMGGAAMLWATVQGMRRLLPHARFALLSIAPARDRRHPWAKHVDVVDARPLLLVGLFLPLAVALWPALRWCAVRRLLAWIPYFRALATASLQIDLSGIAFVDGRGMPLLLYNAACCLPGLAMRVPVAKLAQALGPFTQPLNRAVARFVLSRCACVIARGEQSGRHLGALGLRDFDVLPDVSFTLEVGPAVFSAARARLAAAGISGRPIIVSPSEVVRRIYARSGGDLVQVLAQVLGRLAGEGHPVLLLPHSYASGGSKNNDIDLCRALHAALAGRAALIADAEDPVLLRAIIAQADVFIGCRFHAVVAALSCGVPTLTIGWSHKYFEMAEQLDADAWVLDAAALKPEEGYRMIRSLLDRSEGLRAALRGRIEQVRLDSTRNFERAVNAIGWSP